MDLQGFRAQYPQYQNVPDQDLADGLYNKFYTNVPREQFDQQIGLKKPEGPAPAAMSADPVASTQQTMEQAVNKSVDPETGTALAPATAKPDAFDQAFAKAKENKPDVSESAVRPVKPGEQADPWYTAVGKVIENAPQTFKQTLGNLLSGTAQLMKTDSPTDVLLSKVDPTFQAKKKQDLAQSQQTGQQIAAAASRELQKNQTKVDPKSVTGYAANLLNAGIQFAPDIAAGAVAGPEATIALMGTQAFADGYGESIARGRAPDQALHDGLFAGGVNAVVGAVPVGVVLKGGTTFLARVTGGALTGSAANVLLDALHQGYESGIYDEKTPISQAAAAIKANGMWDEAKNSFDPTTPSALRDLAQHERQTALLGFGLGAAGAAIAHPFVKGAPKEVEPPDIAGAAPRETKKLTGPAQEKAAPMPEDHPAEPGLGEAPPEDLSEEAHPEEDVSSRAVAPEEAKPQSQATEKAPYVPKKFYRLDEIQSTRPKATETDQVTQATPEQERASLEGVNNLTPDQARSLVDQGMARIASDGVPRLMPAGRRRLAELQGIKPKAETPPPERREAADNETPEEEGNRLFDNAHADTTDAINHLEEAEAEPADRMQVRRDLAKIRPIVDQIATARQNWKTSGGDPRPIVRNLYDQLAKVTGVKAAPKELMEPSKPVPKEEAGAVKTGEVGGQEVQVATPTEAQKHAGNYQKGHVNVQGLDISIENLKGSLRQGTGENGVKWSRKMAAPYGYIKKTDGADGDQVDVYVGDHPETSHAFVIDQLKPSGKSFDEHKTFVGFNTAEEAKQTYLKHYPKGWKGFGAITKMPMDKFKEWLKGDTTKPVAWRKPLAFEKPRTAGMENKVPAVLGRSTRRPQSTHDSLLEYLSKTQLHGAEHRGLNRAEAIAEGFDPEDLKQMGHGINQAFTSKGGSFDAAAERAHEAGYQVANEKGAYDKNVLLDRIRDEIHGQKHYSTAKTQHDEMLARHTEEQERLIEEEHAKRPQETLDEHIERLQSEREDLLSEWERTHAADEEREPGDDDEPLFHRAKGGTQGDLLAGTEHEARSVALRNALKKLEAERDAKRNRGQESLETGKADDLFSQARNQRELGVKETKTHLLVPKNQMMLPFAKRVETAVKKEGAAKNVILHPAQQLELKSEEKTGPGAIVGALTHLYKEPQESLILAATDKNDKPIAMLHHTMGTANSSSADPGVGLGALLTIPNVKHFYMVHNHPSGYMEPSGADRRIFGHLENLLRGTGVTAKASIILGRNPGDYSMEDSKEATDYLKTTLKEKGESIPLSRRQFSSHEVATGKQLSSVGAFREYAKGLKEPGITFLDNKVRVIKFLPVSHQEMSKLRTGDKESGAGRLLQEIHDTNSSLAVISSPDNGTEARNATNNLLGFLKNANVKVYDVLRGDESASETGMLNAADPYFHRQGEPTFYSGLLKSAENSKLTKGSPEQWLNTLKNTPGVKQEEMDWVGLPDWLKEQTGPVTRDQVADYVRANQIQVEETPLGGKGEFSTKYGQHVLPGGKDYRELLLRLPTRKGEPRYEAPHFGGSVPNILAHVRFNTRTDADGKRVLFLEEMQSDWGQQGRKKGFGAEIPKGPFVGNTESWSTLATKRMVRYAAENGFDRLAWTTGDQQAERYDLSKHLDAITWAKNGDKYDLTAYDTNHNPVITQKAITPEQIEAHVGKEIAEKIANDKGESGLISGVDLKVGGSGMRGFYDKMLPSAVNKLVKKWGAKVSNTDINLTDMPPSEYQGYAVDHPYRQKNFPRVHSVDVTPEMREAALGGQPLFKQGNEVAPADEAHLGAIKARAEKLLGTFSKQPGLEVVNRYENLPAELRERIERAGDPSNIDAFFDPRTQSIHLIGSRIRPQADVEGMLLHELVGHFGLRDMLPKAAYAEAMDGIARDMDAEVAAKAKQYGLDIKNDAQRRLAAEEVLAEAAQSFRMGESIPDKMRRWINHIAQAIKGLLEKAGLSIKHYDMDFIHDLLARVHNHLRRGAEAQPEDDEPVFHRQDDSPKEQLKLEEKRKGFYEAMRRTVLAVPNSEFAMSFRRLLNPSGVSEIAEHTAQVTRAQLGSLAYETQKAQEQLEQYSRAVDKLPIRDRLDSIHAIETGAAQPITALQPMANSQRQILDHWRSRIQSLGEGHLDNFIEDYFPHYWQNPKMARQIASTFGRRSMKGPASFLKKRTIPTIREGMEKGLKPLTTNPLMMTLLKTREMQRFYSGTLLMRKLKAEGLAKFLPATKSLPEGWKPIEDAVGRVRQWSEEENGFIDRGRYIMPEDAARVINNHLSASALADFPLAQWIRVGSNTMNALQLGFSGFHLGFTTLDAVVSKNALGIERLAHGEPLKAIAAFAEAASGPVAAGLNVRRGYKLLKAYLNPAGATPEIQKIVQALAAAGGRVSMDRYFLAAQGVSPFKGVGVQSLAHDIRQSLKEPIEKMPASLGSAIGNWSVEYTQKIWNDLHEMGKLYPAMSIPFEIAGRVTRASTAIIMEHIVPLQKLGVFSDLASDALRRDPTMSPEKMQRVMQSIWNSVDNRLGEMVYDNLFWNRTFKDAMHLSVRAVGWNYGTISEIGGAPVDTLKLLDKAVRDGKVSADDLGHKIPYVIGMVITTMTLGAIAGYLMTGERPKSIKDYFFPRTGGKTKFGTPERVSLPSYAKDVYEYSQQPGETVLNKLNPIYSTIADLMKNEDFFGGGIYNPDGSWTEQAGEITHFLGKEVLPFSLQGSKQISGSTEPGVGGKIRKALPFIGVTPAPGYITSPEAMEERSHLREESKYLRTLNYELKQAKQKDDAVEYKRLLEQKRAMGKPMRQERRDIRQQKAEERQQTHKQVSSLIDKVGPIIDGKSKAEAPEALRNAGYPALADLLASLPQSPRGQAAQVYKQESISA